MDQLELEILRLTRKFRADVCDVLVSQAQQVFERALNFRNDTPSPPDPSPRTPSSAADAPSSTVDAIPLVEVAPLPAPRTPRPPARTSAELAAIRVKLTALIREQPGRSVAELAQLVGVPAHRVRRLLRRLVRERAIEVEEKPEDPGGLFRSHTFRPIEPLTDALSLPPAAPSSPLTMAEPR